MKKLKIFLLLSILLCFGFALNYEVHAQGGGPKVLEIGDVLPEGQIKISWDFTDKPIASDDTFYIKGTDGIDDYFIGIDEFGNIHLTIFGVDLGSVDLIGNVIITLDNEVTITEFGSDGKDYYEYIDGALFWEVVTPGPKPFEVGDELPAGYIKISWDFTDKFNDIFDENVTFWIVGDGDPENNLYIEIEVWDYGEEVRFTINQEEFYIHTPGEIVISIPIPYTIVQIDASEGYDYYVSIGDALMWEVVTEEDFIYYEAYREGYLDGYYLGYEHAREIYGYYDSRTDEWLSVTEYINRYGTDKLNQSDFYNNFDKYFIPAMIIVFGGAIVLTILKVFKGRE